jgi:hypothetical protein
MRAVWNTARFALLLVFLAFYGARTVDYSPSLAASPAPPRLGFGESLALSDFDGDNLADRARLGGEGARKSIEIYLSRTGKLSVLQFETLSAAHGSLLAQDVNNDGDVDLIWTDLLHPDDVVIWINNGLGRFERICPHQYARAFVIGAPILKTDDGNKPDAASAPARSFWLDQVISAAAMDHCRTDPPRYERDEFPHSALLDRSLSIRGPPSSII